MSGRVVTGDIFCTTRQQKASAYGGRRQRIILGTTKKTKQTKNKSVQVLLAVQDQRMYVSLITRENSLLQILSIRIIC